MVILISIRPSRPAESSDGYSVGGVAGWWHHLVSWRDPCLSSQTGRAGLCSMRHGTGPRKHKRVLSGCGPSIRCRQVVRRRSFVSVRFVGCFVATRFSIMRVEIKILASTLAHFLTCCGFLDRVKATAGHAWGSRGARVKLPRVSLGAPVGLARDSRQACVGLEWGSRRACVGHNWDTREARAGLA